MRVTLLGSDLGNNEAGRLYLLGSVLRRRYEVEIVGLSSRRYGSAVWPPVDIGELLFKPVVCVYRYPDVFKAAKRVLQLINGDVLYAEGLSGTSFGIGLWHRQCKRKPLVLDNSDWDLGHFLLRSRWQRWRMFLRQLRYPNNYLVLLLMEKLAGLADAVTGSNRFVVDRFNGVLVPHGKDTDFFDPVLYDRLALRREWGLGQYKVLMFLGTPHRHKGLEELVTAVRLIDRTDLRLVLVGVGDYPVFVKQLEELGEKSLIFVGSQPFSSVPKFLSMADLVVIPQQDTVVY